MSNEINMCELENLLEELTGLLDSEIDDCDYNTKRKFNWLLSELDDVICDLRHRKDRGCSCRTYLTSTQEKIDAIVRKIKKVRQSKKTYKAKDSYILEHLSGKQDFYKATAGLLDYVRMLQGKSPTGENPCRKLEIEYADELFKVLEMHTKDAYKDNGYKYFKNNFSVSKRTLLLKWLMEYYSIKGEMAPLYTSHSIMRAIVKSFDQEDLRIQKCQD